MAKLVKSVRSARSIKRVSVGRVVEVVKGGETARYTRVRGGWTARVAHGTHGKYSPWEDVVTVFTSWEVAQQVNDVAPYHTREHHAYIF